MRSSTSTASASDLARLWAGEATPTARRGGGKGSWMNSCHDFVEDGEVGEVGQVGVEFDDVAGAACGFGNGFLGFFKDLAGFGAEVAVADNGHGGGIEGI